jgi:hypothetical protein
MMAAEWKDAALEYEMDGKRYGFNISATSIEDAEARLRAIRMTGKVNGWPCYSVKMASALAHMALPFAPLVAFVLNLFRKRP